MELMLEERLRVAMGRLAAQPPPPAEQQRLAEEAAASLAEYLERKPEATRQVRRRGGTPERRSSGLRCATLSFLPLLQCKYTGLFRGARSAWMPPPFVSLCSV